MWKGGRFLRRIPLRAAKGRPPARAFPSPGGGPGPPRRPTPRFAPPRRRGDRRSGAPPSKKEAKTGKTDSSALRPQNDREERRCSILFTPSVWWSRTAPPSRGSYDSAPGHYAPHKEAPGSVPHVILSEAKNPHPSSLAPSLRELSPKVTEGVFPSRTRMGRRILRPYGLRMTERNGGAPFCSPLQSGGAGQLPRQGGAMIVRRVITLHTKKRQAPFPMSF